MTVGVCTDLVLKSVVLLALLTGAARAGAPEARRLQIGQRLRDASICRGPDGTYYLTGTTAVEWEDGGPDFDNCRGARVWKSQDLRRWEDLGFVWDLWEDPDPKGHGGGSSWSTEMYPVPGLPPGERARGMTAPRLAFDGKHFWITFSISGYAAGAIPSDGADVTGPYHNTKLIAEAGGAPTGRSDASLFVDTGGTRYLVWGGGCVARLKDVEALQEMNQSREGQGKVGVEGPRHYLPALIEGYPDDGLPEHGAPYGASVFMDGDRYGFLFTATTLRDGRAHEDSYICHADRLLGPYSKPKPFILDSGRCTVFTGPDGALKAVYASTDPQSPDYRRPVITDYSSPAVAAQEDDTPPPEPGRIVTSIPVPEPGEKPEDVPQLLETIEPVMDHPLRDAALCRGPQGTWYMTGTEASRAPDGTLDWSKNRGVHLWKSTDRQEWTDLGYVWEIERDGGEWQKAGHLDLTCGAEPRIGRAVTAPEIHYLKGTFWIVYSMNGQGIGILKSTTGRAEGPYEDLGRIARQGRDPSLFQDADPSTGSGQAGTVYLVWGQGLYAPMRDDMSGLAGPAKALFINVEWYPRYARRIEVMGQWGSHLTKAGDWYIWTFTTRTGRGGVNSIDTLASWSKSLDGPWGEPCVMLPDGGQSTLVDDGDGRYYATVSGEDERAQCPYLPAITEVRNFSGWPPIRDYRKGGNPLSALQPYRPGGHGSQFYAVQGMESTELDYWIGHPTLIDYSLRDVWMDLFDDGYYYVTGSFWDVERWANHVPIYRSEDKVRWEATPGSIFEAERLSEVPGFPFERYKEKAEEAAERNRAIQLFETKAYQFDGNTYVTFNVVTFGGVLLKSHSGSMNGPFDPIATVGFCEYYQAPDGSLYCNFPGRITTVPDLEHFEAGRAGLAGGTTYELTPPRNLCYLEDVETGMHVIDGKFMVWSTDWNGNYDMQYMVADSLEGPWSTLRIGVPHGGNGFLFRDSDKSWWYGYFNNTNDFGTRAGNFCRLNIMPLHIGWHGGELIIEPKAVRRNRSRLEKLGVLWQSVRNGD